MKFLRRFCINNFLGKKKDSQLTKKYPTPNQQYFFISMGRLFQSFISISGPFPLTFYLFYSII